MTNRETVLVDLLSAGLPEAMPGWKSSRVIAHEGIAYLDYDDPGHTYRVTVTEVPRRHLDTPDNDIAAIGGIGIHLTSVDLSNDTTVVIDAQDGPNYRAAHGGVPCRV